MPSLLSSTEISSFTGIYMDLFDTFSRRVVIYREPLKTSITIDQNDFSFGFGENQAADSYSFSLDTGVFAAKIKYGKQVVGLVSDSNAFVSDGTVSMKVRKDCRDFIRAGKVEKISFDDKDFKLGGEEEKRPFLDSEFWIYELKTVK